MRPWSEHSETDFVAKAEASATSETAHRTPPESAQPKRKSTPSYSDEPTSYNSLVLKKDLVVNLCQNEI